MARARVTHSSEDAVKPVIRARRPSFFYPRAGYFSELVREHDWPPRFVPQPPARKYSTTSESASRGRQAALAKGITGSIHALSRKSAHVMGDATKALVKGLAHG